VSRAERVGTPPPGIGRALRRAGGDIAFNAWTFLGANLIVGVTALAIGYLALLVPAALVLGVLLVLPVAGTMRVAVRLVRDGHTDLGAFAEPLRNPWPMLGLGAAQLAVAAILIVDVLIGLAWGSWAGAILLVGAAYGLIVTWTFAVVAWPILLDPARDADPWRGRLRLALAVLAAHPVRMLGVAIGLGGMLALAALLIMPAVTIAVAAACAVAARIVSPLADRITAPEMAAVPEP
jgi:hypothetical protein